MIGQTVSHYRIIDKLGEGGMGVVYLGEDMHLARRVAIKFLSSTDHHYRARFIREARAVSSLNHPNIATLHDYGETEDGRPFIVMEFVKGLRLSDVLEAGVTLTRAVEIVSSIAEALSEAHEHGIVHRDIKPSNVIVNDRGQVKVLDFGLVKHLFEEPASGVDLDAATLYSTQTRSNVIVGTPLYLSPEQAMGKPVDGRSDLFALGALLYEAITGKSAFSGTSVLEIGAQIIHVNPPPPSQLNPRVPAELERITLKALEKKTDARYQSADELLKDLRAVAPGLGADMVPVPSRSVDATPAGGIRRTNALKTLTTSLRRERFSWTTIIVALALTGFVIWAAYRWWPRSYYQPSAAALKWYDIGTDGLRNGAYYQASKALEQATAIDKNYALAHARLAQAWTELDYTGKAKDALISANTLAGNRSNLTPIDQLYLEAIAAIVQRDFDQAVKSYTEIAKLLPEDSQVYVDLGQAYENSGNVDKALENYLKAIGLSNQQYATPYLRAGVIYQRKQETAEALEQFDKAESLYRAASNNEGGNEVLRQRGILFREKGNYADARSQFEKSLEAARTLGNEAQQINALLELSYLHSSRGMTAEAEQFAQQALDFAESKDLENLATAGLIELGNSFSARDYKKAEYYFDRAIQIARDNKGKLREARGLSNLGGLYIQTARADEGLRFVQDALAYFQQNNYPASVSRCLSQIGRGYRRKGQYNSALQALNQKLQNAQQANNQPLIADSYVEIGAALFDQEKLPEALEHYDNALKIYQAVGNPQRTTYNRANRSNILWRLGRYDEAKQTLNEVEVAVNQKRNDFKNLLPSVELYAALISLSERSLAQADKRATEASALSGTAYPEEAIESKLTLGLIKALSGNVKEGQALCDEAIAMANAAGIARLIALATLAQAEVALRAGDASKALTLATQAAESFASSAQLESQWRACLIAARANERLGNTDKATQQLERGRNILRELEKQWGSDAYKGYTSRPDIQVYYKELGRTA